MIFIAIKDVLKDIPGTIDAIKAIFMDIPGTLESIKNYLQSNPIMAVMIAYAIFNRLRQVFGPSKSKAKEIPIKETKVIEILSKDDYDVKVAEAKKLGAIIVIDFYANW